MIDNVLSARFIGLELTAIVNGVIISSVSAIPFDDRDDDLDPEVRRLLNDLEEASSRHEAELAERERERLEASYGGVEALADRNGKLLGLWVSADLMAHPYMEVERRLNVVIDSLRESLDDDGDFGGDESAGGVA